MSKSRIAALAVATVLSAALPTIAAADTLATPLLGGNGQDGIMFDVVVGPQGLVFQSLGVSIDLGTSDFEFYTIAGGIGSNTSNASAWTLRDTFANVSTAGEGNITSFDITDFSAAAGSTIGFYFTSRGGLAVDYTDGTAVGDVTATNGTLSILTGYGKEYRFGRSFQPREFNGSITYTLSGGVVPEPATWALMIVGFGAVGGAMRRRSSTTVAYAA